MECGIQLHYIRPVQFLPAPAPLSGHWRTSMSINGHQKCVLTPECPTRAATPHRSLTNPATIHSPLGTVTPVSHTTHPPRTQTLLQPLNTRCKPSFNHSTLTAPALDITTGRHVAAEPVTVRHLKNVRGLFFVGSRGTCFVPTNLPCRIYDCRRACRACFVGSRLGRPVRRRRGV